MIHLGFKRACILYVRDQGRGKQWLRVEMVCVLSPDAWGPCTVLLAVTMGIVIIDALLDLQLD